MADTEKGIRVVSELRLPPHLAKYAQKNLTAASSIGCPDALRVGRRLARALRLRVELMPQARGQLRPGPLPLQVATGPLIQADAGTNAEAAAVLRHLLYTEVHRMLHKGHYRGAVPLARIWLIRDLYGIAEEDMPQEAMVADYEAWMAARRGLDPHAHHAHTDPGNVNTPMAERQPAGAHVADLYADTGVQLYLRRCLDPATAYNTPYGLSLAETMARQLDLLVMLAEEPMPNSGRLRMAVAQKPGEALPVRTHNRALHAVERIYSEEFFHTVDQLREQGHTARVSIQEGRERYSITEEEVPMATSIRSYYEYERRQGRQFKRGRPKGARTAAL